MRGEAVLEGKECFESPPRLLHSVEPSADAAFCTSTLMGSSTLLCAATRLQITL